MSLRPIVMIIDNMRIVWRRNSAGFRPENSENYAVKLSETQKKGRRCKDISQSATFFRPGIFLLSSGCCGGLLLPECPHHANDAEHDERNGEQLTHVERHRCLERLLNVFGELNEKAE